MTSIAEAPVKNYQLYVDGQWTDSLSGRTYESSNPFDGRVWARVPDGDAADIDRAVAAARNAFKKGPWSKMTGRDRARLMRRLADILARDYKELALAETTDNGKLLRESLGSSASWPDWYNYFAGMADKIEGSTIPSDRKNFFVYTRHEPIGVVGAILPWNSPILLLTFKLAPGLAAGCTFVVKPSEFTPVSTLEFAKRMEEAGFPPGVFNVVTGGTAEAGRALVQHRGIDKIAFTGSAQTAIAIGRASVENLTPVTYELGGKSPNIIFDDANLDIAVNGILSGIFAASGQTCMAGSRLLVQEGIHDVLVERLAARTKTIRLGSPTEPETEMGPLANRPQLEKVLYYLDVAKAEGVQIVCGGRARPDLGELFVEPTILTNVRNEMRVATEEIFGPVLSVLRFSTEEEAIEIANETRYGLAAAVWTENIRRAHRVAHALQAGTVWINAYRTVAHNAPFGGYKMSGWGRENGVDAVREYTQTKSVYVELEGATRDPFILG
ncbi:aldehyde dehydrogenase [bacterium]|nr:MAG: aldehyde dehydrogenase [bacterium]